ncbi:MAG: alpha/beta fold hydrolase [Gemmatimonadota bacterium]
MTLTTASAQQRPASPDSVAAHLVDLLAARRFPEAIAAMDDRMRAALPGAKLEEIWTTLEGQIGSYQHRGETHSVKSGDYTVVLVNATFAKSALNLKISIDSVGRVGGLFFVPAGPPAPASTGSSTLPSGVTELAVVVGARGWPLPGLLTLPAGNLKVPLVVLVHGSGPQDRDETIGGSKPFRDLAYGLAERGVAVLRYDKRTLVYSERMAVEGSGSLTVEQEVVADALAAIDSARHHPRIDPDRIYLAGHSLGGYLVPRIVSCDRRLAGAVILAGSTRHLEDIVLEQLDYLASQQGGSDKTDAAQREMLRNQAHKIKTLTEQDRSTAMFLIGAPPAYWLDLRSYDPVKTAESLTAPLLILQGGRDYQVTAADFAGWQTLARRPSVTLKQYPSLNHLFVTGSGPSVPAEYEREGHVDQGVIGDIADWITRRGAPRP